MELVPVFWGDNKNDMEAFYEHITNLYPQLTVGDKIYAKPSHTPSESIKSWAKEINTYLNSKIVGVTTVNLSGKEINKQFDSLAVTYIAGFNIGSLIVINEGVLYSPDKDIFNSRKTKVGMHELLENLLTRNGHRHAHHLITHYILDGRPSTCVNDQNPMALFKGLSLAEATKELYDYAIDRYCKSCESKLLSLI